MSMIQRCAQCLNFMLEDTRILPFYFREISVNTGMCLVSGNYAGRRLPESFLSLGSASLPSCKLGTSVVASQHLHDNQAVIIIVINSRLGTSVVASPHLHDNQAVIITVINSRLGTSVVASPHLHDNQAVIVTVINSRLGASVVASQHLHNNQTVIVNSRLGASVVASQHLHNNQTLNVHSYRWQVFSIKKEQKDQFLLQLQHWSYYE